MGYLRKSCCSSTYVLGAWMGAILSVSMADDGTTPSPPAATSTFTIDDVLTAWSTRMGQTTSLDVEVSGTRTVSAKVLARDSGGPFPRRIEGIPETTSYPVRYRFTFNEVGFLRMEGHIRIWDSQGAGLIDKDSVHVFGPGGRKGLYSQDQSDSPVGHITTRSRTSIGRRAVIAPIRMVYVALDEEIGVYAGSELSLSADSAFMSGYNCVGVKAVGISPRRDTAYDLIWVAPDLECFPIRMSRSGDNALLRSIEFNYERDLEGNPLLTGWVDTTYDSSGGIDDLIDVQCDSLVINQPLADSLFDIEFPVGTAVTDLYSETSYKVGADGGIADERPLKPAGMEGNGLVPQPDGNRRGSRFVLVAINVAVLCAVGVWMLNRRRP